jgi:hypothetical protein
MTANGVAPGTEGASAARSTRTTVGTTDATSAAETGFGVAVGPN